MIICSQKHISIDLFNLPPLPDKRNVMDSYQDIPNNFYIPGGKNSRQNSNRKTIDGNEEFVLEILFLECAFGTKYFIVDQINGNMMGIFDGKVEVVGV